ncbi:MAG: right-handed parallel beta-helix repeat-containing protein [Deltaproteobacteria bacterium]|nr:right-handed parallel beta-helix repeat-containing protein [Deltaproteobacteria bacterium]
MSTHRIGVSLLCLLASAPALGATIHVAPPTRDPVADQASILEAAAQAQEGDTIEFDRGRYAMDLGAWFCDRDDPDCGQYPDEAPTANHIVIKGHECDLDDDDDDCTVLDGGGFVDLGVWLLSGVEIREFRFRGSARYAIYASGAKDFTVTSNDFLLETGVPVFPVYMEGITLTKNRFEGPFAGFWVQASAGPIVIRENHGSGVRDWQAIRVVLCSGEVWIEENVLVDNVRGIRNWSPDADVHIAENEIRDSWLVGIRLDESPTTMKENIVTGTDGPGLCVNGGTFTLDEDEFSDNAGGDVVVADPEDGCP